MKPPVFLPAVLSGLLLWTAFFPLDFGPAAFVALVPFLTLVRANGVGRWRRYGAALLGGLVFAGLAVKWVRVAHEMMALFAWPCGSLYVALYWPAALFLLRRLDAVPAAVGLPRLAGDPRDGGRRLPPFALTLPVAWVALEYFRAHFPTGFPFLKWVGLYQSAGFGWYDLGYTQHRVLPLIQAADVGGVYLVSALVAAVNGAAYDWAIRVNVVRRLLRLPTGWVPAVYYREFVVTGWVTLLAAVLVLYGSYRMVHGPYERGPLVAALQGNVGQGDKDQEELKDGDITPLEREYFPLARKARGDGTTRPPDLIVWPETCYPDSWFTVAAEVAADPATAKLHELVGLNQKYVQWTLREKLPPVPMLLGLNRVEWKNEESGRRYNSAILVRPDGTAADHYDKTHLVPFGEYVPLRQTMPWLQSLTPYTHDYSCTPGDRLTRFVLPTVDGRVFRFGVLICYEDSDPTFARNYNPMAGDGPGADFLVNISNDGWFHGTEEHEQHLAICRFRAVEARRSVVRAVNMGISAIIDPDGRVKALPEETWAKSKQVAAVVRADVPIDHRGSVYAAVGDWVPGLCWMIVAVSVVGGWVSRRRAARA